MWSIPVQKSLPLVATALSHYDSTKKICLFTLNRTTAASGLLAWWHHEQKRRHVKRSMNVPVRRWLIPSPPQRAWSCRSAATVCFNLCYKVSPIPLFQPALFTQTSASPPWLQCSRPNGGTMLPPPPPPTNSTSVTFHSTERRNTRIESSYSRCVHHTNALLSNILAIMEQWCFIGF